MLRGNGNSDLREAPATDNLQKKRDAMHEHNACWQSERQSDLFAALARLVRVQLRKHPLSNSLQSQSPNPTPVIAKVFSTLLAERRNWVRIIITQTPLPT